MINSKMIFRILGFLLLIETVMLLCCGGVSLFYKENDLQSFLVSSAITTSIGILLLAIGKDAVKSLNRRDGYVIVSVAWVTFSLFGMLPYYIGGYIPSVTDAFFETMSGFSSTGATILNNIESMPHGISPYIDYVISIFMFLSGINFTLLLLMFNGKIKKFIHDAELKFYFWCVSFFTIFIAVWLHQTSSMEIEEAFRKSLFQVISLQTSTGFATADYMLWPSILWGCLVIVMIIGACAGSTTGGIKCIRMVILFQVVKNEFKHILHPNAVLPVRVNKQVISPSIQSTVLAFTFLYAVIAIISILIMMGLGVGFLESIGTVISSMGNMGPGLGTCGPAFSWSQLPDAAKWLLSFLMLLGRLELFTVLLLFTSDFWKKN